MSSSSLGVIAGNGILPLDVVKTACKTFKVFTVAHNGETDPIIANDSEGITWIQVGQIGRAINFFLKHGVKKVLFAGGISKKKLFKSFRPDVVGMKIMAKALTSQDDAVLRRVCQAFEDAGIEVVSIESVLPQYLPQPGLLTSRGFSEQDNRDIALGLQAARTLGSLDIGQAVVVSKGSVVAVEASEGTAALLERVISLGIHDGILVKTSKPMQEERIDLPSIGLETVQSVANGKGKGIVLEAGKTIILRPSEVILAANKLGVAILVLDKVEIERLIQGVHASRK